MTAEGKRVLLLGAETDVGRASAEALAAAGARLVLVSSTSDAEAAFSVQRLGRKLGATSQAIDATNEAAVRVMVRQVAKEFGGIDATVIAIENPLAKGILERVAAKEMQRTGGTTFVDATASLDVVAAVAVSHD